jgi:hypothetical protein
MKLRRPYHITQPDSLVLELDRLLLVFDLSPLLASRCPCGIGVRTCSGQETRIDRITLEAFVTLHLPKVPDPVVIAKPLGNVSQHGFNPAGPLLDS